MGSAKQHALFFQLLHTAGMSAVTAPGGAIAAIALQLATMTSYLCFTPQGELSMANDELLKKLPSYRTFSIEELKDGSWRNKPGETCLRSSFRTDDIERHYQIEAQKRELMARKELADRQRTVSRMAPPPAAPAPASAYAQAPAYTPAPAPVPAYAPEPAYVPARQQGQTYAQTQSQAQPQYQAQAQPQYQAQSQPQYQPQPHPQSQYQDQPSAHTPAPALAGQSLPAYAAMPNTGHIAEDEIVEYTQWSDSSDDGQAGADIWDDFDPEAIMAHQAQAAASAHSNVQSKAAAAQLAASGPKVRFEFAQRPASSVSNTSNDSQNAFQGQPVNSSPYAASPAQKTAGARTASKVGAGSLTSSDGNAGCGAGHAEAAGYAAGRAHEGNMGGARAAAGARAGSHSPSSTSEFDAPPQFAAQYHDQHQADYAYMPEYMAEQAPSHKGGHMPEHMHMGAPEPVNPYAGDMSNIFDVMESAIASSAFNSTRAQSVPAMSPYGQSGLSAARAVSQVNAQAAVNDDLPPWYIGPDDPRLNQAGNSAARQSLKTSSTAGMSSAAPGLASETITGGKASSMSGKDAGMAGNASSLTGKTAITAGKTASMEAYSAAGNGAAGNGTAAELSAGADGGGASHAMKWAEGQDEEDDSGFSFEYISKVLDDYRNNVDPDLCCQQRGRSARKSSTRAAAQSARCGGVAGSSQSAMQAHQSNESRAFASGSSAHAPAYTPASPNSTYEPEVSGKSGYDEVDLDDFRESMEDLVAPYGITVLDLDNRPFQVLCSMLSGEDERFKLSVFYSKQRKIKYIQCACTSTEVKLCLKHLEALKGSSIDDMKISEQEPDFVAQGVRNKGMAARNKNIALVSAEVASQVVHGDKIDIHSAARAGMGKVVTLNDRVENILRPLGFKIRDCQEKNYQRQFSVTTPSGQNIMLMVWYKGSGKVSSVRFNLTPGADREAIGKALTQLNSSVVNTMLEELVSGRGR